MLFFYNTNVTNIDKNNTNYYNEIEWKWLNMKLYDYLINNYELNVPILINDINIKDMSDVNIRKQLSRLIEMKLIEKYAQGVYYLPKKTVLGVSKLSFEDVVNKKYISNDNEIYGFYSGLSFLNKLGISTQIPFTYEIVTNKETSRKRVITINNRNIILRKPYVEINKNNVLELQFLDFINSNSINLLKNNYELIKEYIKKLNKKVFVESLICYPAKTSKKLIESRLFFDMV